MRALAALAGWPVGAAAAQVWQRRPDAPRASLVGVAGDVDRRFALASITKLFTALAVLVAVEEGTLSLDEPAGPPGSTVAHLLAHASGLSPSGDRVLAAPATRRIYSNGGFELLARHLARRADLPFSRYLHEAVFEPLALRDMRLGPEASPAAGLTGAAADVGRLGAELLAPRLVAAETLRRATEVAFPGLAGVLPGFGRMEPNDWGLGFELRDAKTPHWTGRRNSPETFGHFGQSGGFLWVDPLAGVACTVLTDRPFGAWAAAAWPPFADSVLTELGVVPR